MKYLLYILILVSTSCLGQEVIKISALPSSTDPDSNDELIINEDGTTSRITKAVLQQQLMDSIGVHSPLINTNTHAISDGVDSIAAHDTKLNVLMDSIGVHGPLINTNTHAISDGVDSFAVHDGKINVNITGINGRVLTDAELRDSIINLITRIAQLETYIFEPGTDSATLQLYYKFEENVLDETAYNRDGTASAAFVYTDLDSDGDYYAGNFNAITKYVTSPSFDQTSSFVVMVDPICGNDSAGSRFLLGNMDSGDGWELRMDVDSGRVSFITGDGVDLDSIYTRLNVFSIRDTIYPFTPFNIVATTGGKIYINGDTVSVSGSVISGFATSSTIKIGVSKAGAFPAYCFMDNVKIYRGTMDSAEIANIYALNEYHTTSHDPLPIFIGGQVYNTIPDVVYLYFSEFLYNYKADSVKNAFTFTVNDSIFAIDSTELNFGSIMLFTDTLEHGDELNIDYDADYYSGLEDFNGNKLATFYNRIIANDIEAGTDSVSVATIHYRFENNNHDDASDFDFEASNFIYSTEHVKAGTYAARFTGSGEECKIPISFEIADTFSLSVWVYNTSTANDQEILTSGGQGGNGLELRFGGTDNDIDFFVNDTVAEANNVNSDDLTENTWHHLALVYESGAVAIYWDNVDETDDATAGTDIDKGTAQLSLFDIAYGWFDEFQLYNDLAFTAANVAYLFANPDSTIKEAGSGGTPYIPPADTGQLDHDAYSIPLLGPIDFDDQDSGLFTFDELRMAFTGSTVPQQDEGNPYYVASGTQRPWIYEYEYDSAGIPQTSQGVRFTYVANHIKYNPVNYHMPIGPHDGVGGGQDPSNTDVYMSFNVKYIPANAWDNYSTIHVWKTCSFGAGYVPEGYSGKDTYDKRLETSDKYDYAEFSLVGKPTTDGNKTRFKTYPIGGWQIDYSPMTDVPDPDGGGKYLVDIPSEPVTNVTLRLCLGDQYTANAFYEVFINGKFAFRHDEWPPGGDPIMARATPWTMVVDLFVLKYHWGGGDYDVPTQDAQIVYDDIYVFKYRPDFKDAQIHTKSKIDRELLIPGWHTTGGYKRSNYQGVFFE